MTEWISKVDACEVAEPHGAFQHADAQGDVRYQFANDILERHERIRKAAPMLLEALQAVLHDCNDLDMVESNQPGRDKGPFQMAMEAIAAATGEQA